HALLESLETLFSHSLAAIGRKQGFGDYTQALPSVRHRRRDPAWRGTETSWQLGPQALLSAFVKGFEGADYGHFPRIHAVPGTF
ncbi:hypothetical protein, partial [Microbacterium sp. Bi128]|uniref:hypothetical protein n=1 Tax=Microbacterium sp. Bi128 TaxID=2821115 RepID=UPI001E5389EB